MNKKLILVLLVLLGLILVATEVTSDSNQYEKDAEDLQNAVDKIPINDDGEFDPDKMGFNKSRADERIEAINNWLNTNAPWLKLVFGMVPEISWLFAFNLYFWMFFLVMLVLNGNVWEFAIPRDRARWVGLGAFIILIVTKIILNVSKFVYNFYNILWNYVLPWGIAAAIAIMVALAIAFIALAIFQPQILLAISKMLEARREKKAKEQQELDQKILHTQVEAMQGR